MTIMQKTILAALFVPGLLLAQQDASFQERVDARTKAISGRLGFDFTSQYFFRGIQQENQNIIGQPSLDLSLNVHDGERGLRRLNVVTGIFESLHDGPTGGAGGIWYESRFYLGVEAQFGERFHGGVRYNTYSTPNGAALALVRPIQELQFHVRLDDAGIFSNSVSLQPTATVAIELVGQRDLANDRGIYAELAIAPAWSIGQLGSSELTLSAPAKLGMSFGNYYQRPRIAGGGGGGGDDFIGYLQAGGVLSAPLNFMPARLGPWEGHVGLHLILLGNNADRRNGGDEAELFLEFGMSTTF